MTDAPDPSTFGPSEIVARPVVVEARPLQFADAPVRAWVNPNPMRIESISRGQALMDIALLIGGLLLMFGLFNGVRFLMNPTPDDSKGRTEESANFVTSESDDHKNLQHEKSAEGVAPKKPVKVDLASTLVTGLACSALVLGIGKWRGLSPISVGMPAFTSIDVLLGLAAALAAFAAHFLGIGVTLLTWPNAWEKMSESSMNIVQALPPGSLWKYLLIFVAVGFYEELVFRGFLLTRIRRLVGPWWLAVVLSSICFAVPHVSLQNATVLPSLFLLASAFAAFTVTRRSLYPAMIGHWLFNSIMIIFLHSMVGAANQV